MANVVTAIGLMSGTSMDGIDVALIRSDGELHLERGLARTYPYPPDMRALLASAMNQAVHLTHRSQRPGVLAEAEAAITDLHCRMVESFLEESGVSDSEVSIIGFHGQTVLHRPEAGLTVQLGDGRAMARQLGQIVASDFRAADVAAGGQGAPFAPAYHRAMSAVIGVRPCAFLNLGGVANVTYVDAAGNLIAFDTGPGNAMIDDWVYRHTGAARDEGGALSASGRINGLALSALLAHPYFGCPFPKSLDRNAFSPDALEGLDAADGAATLTAFTAEAVRSAVPLLPGAPALWVVCGGGRHNRSLMAALEERLPGEVAAAEAFGFDGDAVEAEAFAYLAIRAERGLPLSFPGTTGVPKPVCGGVIHRP